MKFEYWRGSELLFSEYPDQNSPAFKISLDIRKKFYKEQNGWSDEYSYHCIRTLDLQLKMEKIVSGVVVYRSYRVVKDTNNDQDGW